MFIKLKKYVLDFIYRLNNCSLNIDSDFWEDLVDFDFEEVNSNV